MEETGAISRVCLSLCLFKASCNPIKNPINSIAPKEKVHQTRKGTVLVPMALVIGLETLLGYLVYFFHLQEVLPYRKNNL